MFAISPESDAAPTFAAGLALAMALTFSCSNGNDGDGNSGGGNSCDIKNYKTVKIGDQTWMAGNLNCNVSGSKCYNDSTSYCNKYGRLYDWETAMRACPSGWHLPSYEEWKQLADYVENDKECTDCTGKYLKATSGWYSNGNGQDTYDFSAMPGGYYNGNHFGDVGYHGSWWSSSEGNSSNAYAHGMGYDGEYTGIYNHKDVWFSVRCLQN
ncbi:MAG: hypothetical protein LBH25_08500 [Fibromonadaceae bacterium]|jgi:uncharacterized protein (TIGR02145 family)|nr:hypothetical protein [Fibromonadaceae bacterium]